MDRPHLLEDGQTICARHDNIQQNHVRFFIRKLLHRLVGGRSF
jgi:hypothetical protein